MKISVIVPVYGIERYIERCTESLLSQTFKDDVEFIFVDDCTKDRSICILQDVIERHPERKSQIQIVRHEENQGLPAARNTGLAIANGEYIMHIDGDDFTEPTMLDDMYSVAVDHDADIVWTDLYLTYEGNERYLSQPDYSTPKKALQGILRGEMKYNVWNKLVRKDLYTKNDIKFPAGFGMGEDMTIIKLFCHASKVMYIPKAYYHYVKTNSQAFSQTYSARHLEELLHNVSDLSQYLSDYMGDEYKELISLFKLEVKFPFLISDAKEKHTVWKNWFKDANEFVWKNPSISLRRKLLQGMASMNQWWYVNLYYKVLYKNPLMRVLNIC